MRLVPAESTASRPETIAARRAVGFLALPLACTALVYWSLVRNYFFEDDFLHLYRIANTGPLEFFLTPHGGHILVVRNLIFYAFYSAFGLNPVPYFVSVLGTHLVNVYLLFRLIQHLTGSPRLACVGATLWGMSPVSEEALGWYSVYGHVLAATIMLWVLGGLVRAVNAREMIPRRRLLSWYLLLLAGVTCFGVGIAVALAFPVMAFLLLPENRQRRQVVAVFCSLFVLVPILYLGLQVLYQSVFATSANEALALAELLPNWRPALRMFGQLLLYGSGHLLIPYGEAAGSRADALYQTVAAAWVVGAVWTLYSSAPQAKRYFLAFVISALAMYAIIAVGRGPILSEFDKPTGWMGAQPRYQYAVSAVLTVILCLLLAEVRALARLRPWWRDVVVLGLVGVLVVSFVRFGRPLDHHAPARAEVQRILQAIGTRVAAASGQDVYISNCGFASIEWNPQAFPGCAGIFVIAYPDNVVGGKRVYFVESNARILAAARAHPRGRAAALLVTPAQVPARPQ